MNMNYIEKINEINDYAKAKLSTSRYKHSVQVATMCEELCVKAPDSPRSAVPSAG